MAGKVLQIQTKKLVGRLERREQNKLFQMKLGARYLYPVRVENILQNLVNKFENAS
jgi:hypothetical protein